MIVLSLPSEQSRPKMGLNQAQQNQHLSRLFFASVCLVCRMLTASLASTHYTSAVCACPDSYAKVLMASMSDYDFILEIGSLKI